MTFRAAIFDFDGVLVNSEPLHFRSLQEALRSVGIRIDEGEYFATYLAYDDRQAIRLALERYDLPADPASVEELAGRKAEIFEGLLATISFFPGVPDLLESLHSEVPLGIASGALHAEIEAILEARGVRDLFEAVVGADDVRNTKPHPEPYLEAMGRLERRAQGLRPEDCLVFEDSMPGVAAALAAGMKVVAVANSYPATKLSAAHRVVDSLEGLRPEGLHDLFS
jgi:HAD superfamily hydrolase (TIGR01509 family)